MEESTESKDFCQSFQRLSISSWELRERMALTALQTLELLPTVPMVDIRRSMGPLAVPLGASAVSGPSSTTTRHPLKLMAEMEVSVEPLLLVVEELAALREPLPILEQGLLVLTERMGPGMGPSDLAEAAAQVGSGSTALQPR